jgi:hypothetical protein
LTEEYFLVEQRDQFKYCRKKVCVTLVVGARSIG